MQDETILLRIASIKTKARMKAEMRSAASKAKTEQTGQEARQRRGKGRKEHDEASR